ncbi:16S rRNA (guanine(966)-N(2))-methyltransferase RsmD [Microbacterium sp.]|uniref:16S rRNA (guanine(966)-N(2))-methyltransferase RsmD n=1 Tax=Microbacterium sp. TaxID=51671 RepID=UPI0039E2B87D
MTRIIGGVAGSLSLAVPRSGTRPTSDRVRESLFGALEGRDVLRQARVVDLYAGSGALGLECISRGAASADLVESAPRSAAVTAQNARSVQHAVGAAPVRVHRMTAESFLRTSTGRFDLAFLDPPYDLDDAGLTTTLGLLTPRLADGAIVIVERSSRSPEPHVPEELSPDRTKRYGDTTLWWYTRE